jgi:ankyrin repeat protein
MCLHPHIIVRDGRCPVVDEWLTYMSAQDWCSATRAGDGRVGLSLFSKCVEMNDTDLVELWRAASQGLPLPAEVHVDSVPFVKALVRVAIWNDHGHTVTELVWLSRISFINRDVGNHLTPLAYAAMHGSEHAVSALLDAKAAVNQGGDLLAQPLSFAVARGHSSCVSLLVSSKVNVDEVDSHGHTLVALAASDGNCNATNLLVTAKANVNRPDHEGKTPLFHASHGGYVSVA